MGRKLSFKEQWPREIVQIKRGRIFIMSWFKRFISVRPGWYISRYPDVRKFIFGSRIHFATFGWQEGRLPNAGENIGRKVPETREIPLKAEHGLYDYPSNNGADYTVSVVMPVRNRGMIVHKAIESVLSQTHRNIELLIVDDMSSDNTSAVIRKFAETDSRVQVLAGRARGVSDARNIALFQARGRFVAYLDSDNWWDSDYLTQSIGGLLGRRASHGYSAQRLFDDEGFCGNRFYLFDSQTFRKGNFIDLNSYVHERSLLDQHGFFRTSLKRFVDWDLIARFSLAEPPATLFFCQANYYIGSDPSRISITEPDFYRDIVSEGIESRGLCEVRSDLIPRINILGPYPEANKSEWGDYHLGESLCAAFQEIGLPAKLYSREAWSQVPHDKVTVNIVISGLDSFEPRKNELNLIWLISHPDRVRFENLESYDHAFVASELYANLLKEVLGNGVSVMLQATDAHKLVRGNLEDSEGSKEHSIVFVGNSKARKRPALEWANKQNVDLVLVGRGHDLGSTSAVLHQETISHKGALELYQKSEAVVNDHWEDMGELGFISNRIFDSLGVGSFAITDEVVGLNIFPEGSYSIISSPEDGQPTFAEATSALSIEAKNEAQRLVLDSHTFLNRAKQVALLLEEKFGVSP